MSSDRPPSLNGKKISPVIERLCRPPGIDDIKSDIENGDYDTVVDLLTSSLNNIRLAVLLHPGSIAKLAAAGHAEALIEMITALDARDQRTVLALPEAVPALADHGQAGPVIEMIRRMPEPAQRAILEAVSAREALTANGQAQAVEAIMQSWQGDRPADAEWRPPGV